MKILLINDYGTMTGGAEHIMIGLRDKLRQRGHDARLFASSARPLDARSLADYECFGTLSGLRTALQTFNPFALLKLHRILQEFQPDCVQVSLCLTQLSPSILLLLSQVPTVYLAQWQRAICPTGFKLLPDNSPCKQRAGKVCLRTGCLGLVDWLLISLQNALWQRWRSVFDRTVAVSDTLRSQLQDDGFALDQVIHPGASIRPLEKQF
ncbi:MAG: glycosyltransferase family 4 protein, partial [Terriglobales bacterium]